MRSIKFLSFPIILLINHSLNAQSTDTLSARHLIEKGSKGDIIVGEKNKKDQIKDSPVLLHQKDSVCGKDALRSSKKLRKKQNKRN
jgi:hypothetical protein